MTLRLDVDTTLHLTPDDLVGQRIAVLGVSGSGKSNTVAVFAEEMLPHLPATFIDPEGEFWALQEKHELVVVGGSHADIPLEVSQMAALARWSVAERRSVVLDLAALYGDDQQQAAHEYLKALWDAVVNSDYPYMLIVDEVHEFAPQQGTTLASQDLERVAKRGRKRGLLSIFATQRPAQFDKNVLSQASIRFAHKHVDPADIAVWKQMMTKDNLAQLPTLQPGQAFVSTGDGWDLCQMRQRNTFDSGATRGLTPAATPSLKSLGSESLAALRDMLASNEVEPEHDRVAELEAELATARERIATLETELSDMETALAIASKFEVTMPQHVSVQGDVNASDMHVGNVHGLSPVVTPVSESPSPETVNGVKRKPKPAKPKPSPETVKRQRQMFDRLLMKVRNTKPSQRQVLGYILTNQDKWYTPSQVSKLCQYAGSVNIKPFADMDLLERTSAGLYNANAYDYLRTAYPALDTDDLINELMAVLP